MEIYDYITCACAAHPQKQDRTLPLFMVSTNDYSLRPFHLIRLWLYLYEPIQELCCVILHNIALYKSYR